MESNFHKLHREREEQLPPELEHHITQQVNNLSLFGKVVELFVPNALNTAAKIIGGCDDCPTNPAAEGGRDTSNDWRRPPNR